MSEISGMGNATASGGPEPSAQPDEVDPSSRSLEERLAIARSKREQVLKAKGKSMSKPVMKRPSFMDDDPAANWDLSRPEPEVPQKESATSAQPERNETPAPLETPVVSAEPIAPAPAAARSNSVSVSWVVIVAFACFFGLGSGVVLSIGAVVAMGWVSISDLAPRSISATMTTASQGPEIHTTIFKPLAPPVAAAAQVSLRHSPLVPVSTVLSAPAVLAAITPDAVQEAVPSPAPQFDASGGTGELVSRLDFAPAEVAMRFALPSAVSAAPTPLMSGETGSDVIPQILAKSEIRPLTYLADLTAPTIDKATVRLASLNQVLLRPQSGPTLVKSTPGVVPEIAWARLNRPVIFDDAIVAFAAVPASDLSDLAMASLTQDVPQRAQRFSAPAFEARPPALPAVGTPHARPQTLAQQLSMTAAAASSINLVTFAPANVPAETLAAFGDVLGSSGFPVAGVNRVNFKVSKTHIRYYRARDEAVARALADEVGGSARNFSNIRSRPPAGQVELWIEGNRQGVRASAQAPVRATNTAEQQAALKAQLESRLVDRLRRGEHLGSASR